MKTLPTALKCDWVLPAHDAGLSETEVGAFLPPAEFPQLADAADVVAFAKTIPGLRVSALVHDAAGARAALAAGADVVTLPVSASERHSRANVGRSAGFDASLGGIGGSTVQAGVSGNLPVEDVAALFDAMGVATGVDRERLLELRRFIGEQPDAQGPFQAVARAAARRRGGPFRPA